MLKIITFLFILLLLPSCATNESNENFLLKKFEGTSLDDFVLEYGTPIDGDQKYTTSNGIKVYRFLLGRDGYSSGYGNSIQVGCQFYVYTDNDNIIQRFKIDKDTIGAWQLSRCAEIFDLE